MISSLIEGQRETFGLVGLHSPDGFNRARKTGFTWSPGPGVICLAMNRSYVAQALTNPDVVGILTRQQALPRDLDNPIGMAVCEKPDELFYWLHNQSPELFGPHPELPATRIGPGAVIAPSAVLPERGVQIGANVEIGANCVLHEGTVIGDDTVLHPACVIGAPGLFSKRIAGEKQHVRHFGGVRIGNGCVLHPGVNVARSVNFEEHTEIADRVHIGPNAAIGHDVSIHAEAEVSVGVILAGRCTVGRNTWVGAGAMVANALTIGDNARVNIGAVVIHDVADGKVVSGNFAVDHARNIKKYLAER